MKDQPHCERVFEVRPDGSLELVDHRWMSDGYADGALAFHRCDGKCWIRLRGELEGTWRMEYVLGLLISQDKESTNLAQLVSQQRILKRELAKRYGGRGAGQ